MDKNITIAIKDLIVMAVIAFGDGVCDCFVYTPKLPLVFTNNLRIEDKPLMDFKGIAVYPDGELKFLFANKHDDLDMFSIHMVNHYFPCLFASIVTHVCDLIENLKKC